MGHVERLPVEIRGRDLGIDLDQVHRCASLRAKWTRGTAATISEAIGRPVEKKRVCISRRSGQRWLIMKRLGAAQESMKRSRGSWCARSTLSSSSCTPGENRANDSSKVILKANAP